MVQKTLNTNSRGNVFINLTLCLSDQLYVVTCLSVFKDLCSDVILSQDFLCEHQSAMFKYSGSLLDLTVTSDRQFCVLNVAKVETSLFPNLLNCKPIAIKSRYFNKEDQAFITKKIQHLLSKGIIEESILPWWAQLVVVNDRN